MAQQASRARKHLTPLDHRRGRSAASGWDNLKKSVGRGSANFEEAVSVPPQSFSIKSRSYPRTHPEMSSQGLNAAQSASRFCARKNVAAATAFVSEAPFQFH